LKSRARSLRSNLTDAERRLWSCLRRKQILDVQFYRQKTIGNYIVDFYAPSVNLVVEVDGAQHLDARNVEYDERRSKYFKEQGLKVLRFDDRQALLQIDSVAEAIFQALKNPS
jgi:very-short-patch-repair endonuclease